MNFIEFDDELLDNGTFFARKEREAKEVRYAVAVARDRARKTAKRSRRFVCERHGGLLFWRIGRFGGSFYVTKKGN